MQNKRTKSADPDEGPSIRVIMYQKETQNSRTTRFCCQVRIDNREQSSAKNILTENTILLARANNLGVHSHEVVVDGVLLLLLGFRCIHALAQLSLESSTALCAVSSGRPAVKHRRHHYHAGVLLILIRPANTEVVDGVETHRVQPGGEGAFGCHGGQLFGS